MPKTTRRQALLMSLMLSTSLHFAAPSMGGQLEKAGVQGPLELPKGVSSADIDAIAKIINDRFAQYACERVRFELFDLLRPEVEGYPKKGLPYIVKASNKHAVESYNALVELGLLSRKETTIQEMIGKRTEPVETPVYIYSQTPLGKSYDAPDDPGYSCVCKTRLLSIDAVAHKPPAFGQDLFEVVYTIERTDIAPWASDKRVQAAWSDVARLVSGPKMRREAFLRGEKGWTPGSPTLFAPHR